MTKTKKILWVMIGAGTAITISVAASILWATPEAEISLRGWATGLLRAKLRMR
jgi:flagellar biosynthesis/type III secretory pathway M-ring protein FliF/YscJ